MMYKERFIAVIKHNGKILRERNDEVLLPFGSEYSILLKNLESRKAVVRVNVDGQDVLDGSSLIVKPNSDLELKGFMKGMSVKNKFKFIQKTKEIINHRGDKIDDGIVRVEFCFEKQKVTKIVEEEKWVKPWIAPVRIWICSVCGHYPCVCDYWKPSNPWIWRYHTTDNKLYALSQPATYNCFGQSNDSDGSKTTGSCNFFETGDLPTPNNDEGITVKGSRTNQDFVYGYTRELEESSSVIVLKLKGTTSAGKSVSRPITVKTKLTCPTCGRKSRSTKSFCGNCGTCLE